MTRTKMMHGFTVIEVMLFLAVSSALTILLIVGTGSTIQQQRYSDSVNTATLELKSQFTKAAQVINDRHSGWVCSPGSLGVVGSTGGQSRGVSNCTIIGRYVTISADGKTILGHPVVATRAVPAGATNDTVALQGMGLVIHRSSGGQAAIDQTSYRLEWDSKLERSGSAGTVAAASLLIYRSPLTGVMSSRAVQTTNASISTILGTTPSAIGLCVASDTPFMPRTGIEISARASTESGVRVVGEAPCR